MKRIILTFLITSFCVFSSFSQEIVTNSIGKKIRLNQNGTWEYVESETKAGDYTCENLIKTESDPISGNTATSLKEVLVLSEDSGQNGIAINLIWIQQGRLMINMAPLGAGNCIKKGQIANILFRDGTRETLYHTSEFNCDGIFTMAIGRGYGTKKKLQALSSKEIQTIRVYTASGNAQENLNSDQSKLLMNSFKCLSEKSQ